MNLFELSAKLRLDSSDYEKGLADAEQSANSFASSGLSKLSSYAKTGVKTLAMLGTAAVGAGASLFGFAGKVASTGDNIDKMSQKLGMSAQTYQEWDFIMQHCGTTIESMQSGMKTLANAAENNNDAFAELGMTQEQIASMSQEELFGATIKALQNVEDGTRRTYLAGKLLGRGATELGALLNTSAEDTEKMRQAVHDLGGVMSDDAVKASAAYQDSLQDVKTAAQGLLRGAVSKAIPSLTNTFRTLSSFLSGPKGKAIQEKIGKIIGMVAEAAVRVIPKIIDLAGDVIRSLKENAVAIGAVVLAIKAMTNPIGTAISAVGLLIGAFGLMRTSVKDVDEELANLSDSERDLVENARNAAEKFAEAREAFGEAFANINTEMTNVQSAWETLQGLVDENGKIAEGHEEEVQNLLNVINSALGTQYQLNGDMIEQYKEMSDTVDALIEKQWAQKLLDARSDSYAQAKAQLEDAQKRLGIAKLEYEEKKKAYELDTDTARLAANEKELAILQEKLAMLTAERETLEEGTEARLKNAEAINETASAIYDLREENKKLEERVGPLRDAYYRQGQTLYEVSNQVNGLISEISRYEDAYSEFVKGNYAETKEILERGIVDRWKHVQKGQELSKAEIEDMKRDYAIMYAVYEDYRKKLADGQEGYNEKELERLRQQMLDLGAILDDQLNMVGEKGSEIGQEIGRGISKGLEIVKGRVIKTSSGLVESAIYAMKSTAQIASPSKRGRAIGENIGDSVGLGMDDSYNNVIRSADDLTEGIFDALDNKPTQSYVKTGNGNGFGEMLGVLRDIRDNIGNEIVMQDGTLVGWMDKQLGRIAAQKVRGTA